MLPVTSAHCLKDHQRKYILVLGALTTLALELETSTKMAIDVNQDHRQLDFEKATTRTTSSHYSVVELADQVMF